MASWHDAARMQLERVHLQHSLFNDPPVLIRATTLPGVLTAPPHAESPSMTAGRRPAEHTDPLTDGRGCDFAAHLLPDHSRGGAGGGSALTHDNGRVGSPVRASADAATGGSF